MKREKHSRIYTPLLLSVIKQNPKCHEKLLKGVQNLGSLIQLTAIELMPPLSVPPGLQVRHLTVKPVLVTDTMELPSRVSDR